MYVHLIYVRTIFRVADQPMTHQRVGTAISVREMVEMESLVGSNHFEYIVSIANQYSTQLLKF